MGAGGKWKKFGWGMTQTPWKLSSFESIIDLLILHAFIRIFYILRLSFMYPCIVHSAHL